MTIQMMCQHCGAVAPTEIEIRHNPECAVVGPLMHADLKQCVHELREAASFISKTTEFKGVASLFAAAAVRVSATLARVAP